MIELPAVAVVGGTGHLGAAIARRLALAGYPIIIGSRDPERAREAAARLSGILPTAIRGASNPQAAREGTIVIVAVPFTFQAQILADIRSSVGGKIIVDTTVPLMPPKVMRVQLPPEGSAAQIAQKILGDKVKVVSAFHNVPAHKLATDQEIDCDVLVFGDDKESCARVIDLVKACRLRGLHGGSLANSAAAEAFTSILISINKHYSVDGAGIRITGELK
ncbi:MAG TPA: NADPH-dependent F420 reductase [Steroidobacteraceae bacterium]